MINENKVSKYMLYAIGEIILVVIGILIALSINNWNEGKKVNALEEEILMEVRDNLIADTSYFARRFSYQKENAYKIKLLIRHLELKLNYHDSLDHYFFVPVLMEGFQITRSGYETLKSIGLEKIQSKKIRKSITHYYDVQSQNISSVVDLKNLDNTRSMSNFHKTHFRRVILTDLSQSEQISSYKFTGYRPLNYESLIDSDFYLNFLYERRGYKLQTYNKMYNEIIEEASNLLNLINDELKN